MRVEAGYISNIGKVRKKNEDSLLLNDLLISEADMYAETFLTSSREKQIYAVADGMGGHQRGELASNTVLRVFKERFTEIENASDMRAIISSSKDALNILAREDRLKYGMGTTVSGIFLKDKGCFVFNCGDSRVYRLKGAVLERITKDHSVVQELLDIGSITEDEMRYHPQKNIITSAVIADLQPDLPEAEISEISVPEGSTFLICTDGLWESIDRARMEGCFKEDAEPLRCLFEKAIAGEARDNISAIVIRVTGA